MKEGGPLPKKAAISGVLATLLVGPEKTTDLPLEHAGSAQQSCGILEDFKASTTTEEPGSRRGPQLGSTPRLIQRQDRHPSNLLEPLVNVSTARAPSHEVPQKYYEYTFSSALPRPSLFYPPAVPNFSHIISGLEASAGHTSPLRTRPPSPIGLLPYSLSLHSTPLRQQISSYSSSWIPRACVVSSPYQSVLTTPLCRARHYTEATPPFWSDSQVTHHLEDIAKAGQ